MSYCFSESKNVLSSQTCFSAYLFTSTLQCISAVWASLNQDFTQNAGVTFKWTCATACTWTDWKRRHRVLEWNSLCSCVYAHYFVKLFCVQWHAVFKVAILHLGEVVPLFMACLFTLPPPKTFAMNICVIFDLVFLYSELFGEKKKPLLCVFWNKKMQNIFTKILNWPMQDQRKKITM